MKTIKMSFIFANFSLLFYFDFSEKCFLFQFVS